MAGKRILIVDDDEELLGLLRFYLSKLEYDVTTVSDGRKSLQMLEKDNYDLLLLDVMVPGLDGYHIAHEVTERLGTNAPKIIIMTSRNLAKESGVALMSGSDMMIQKPLNLNELKSKIKTLLP